MKAQELRIGNYLERYNKIVKLIEIGIKHKDDTNYYLRCEFDNNGYWIDQFKPIPLTEEILLKFGFEKLTDKNKGFLKTTYSNKWLIFNFDNEILSIDCRPLLKIKYLHQLQNLYFALTGKELEINL